MFTRDYTELREAFGSRQWEFLRKMSADFFEDPSVEPDPVMVKQVREELGLAKLWPIRAFATDGLSVEARAQLEPATQHWLDEWLRRHTPMREPGVPHHPLDTSSLQADRSARCSRNDSCARGEGPVRAIHPG